MSIFTILFYQPILNFLVFSYYACGQSLGLAIILTTVAIKLILIPLTAPGLKSAKKMQELKPTLDKLKEKFKDDNQGLAQAQMALYKEHGINPLGGLLPMVLQIVILIVMFNVFRDVLKTTPENFIEVLNPYLYPLLQFAQGQIMNFSFFGMELTKPDTIVLANAIDLKFYKLTVLPGVLLIITAIFQVVSSKAQMAVTSPKNEEEKVKEVKREDKPADEMDFAKTMQQQMLFMMPVMTILIGMGFPSGLVLYWLAFSVMILLQQVYINRADWIGKAKNLVNIPKNGLLK